MQVDNDYHDENVKYIHNRTFHYMMMCVEIAKKSDMRCKHGCIIVDKNGKIVSEAHNKRNGLPDKHIEDPKKRPFFSSHAEETALKKMNRQGLDGASLYVVRFGHCHKNPIFMNSKPCPKCTPIILACMKNYGLKKAYYSTGEEFEEIK